MADWKLLKQDQMHRPAVFLRSGWARLFAVLLAFSPLPAAAQNANTAVIDTASLTLTPLPTQAIATIKGSGFQGPGLGNMSSTSRTITLWDELKPPIKSQNELSGISTITINGTVK